MVIHSCLWTISASLRRFTGTTQVRDAARRRDRLDLETVLQPFQAVPYPLAPAEHDRHDDDVQVVDQVGGQELPDRGRPAPDPDVLVADGRTGGGQGGGRAGVDEVEGRPALH